MREAPIASRLYCVGSYSRPLRAHSKVLMIQAASQVRQEQLHPEYDHKYEDWRKMVDSGLQSRLRYISRRERELLGSVGRCRPDVRFWG